MTDKLRAWLFGGLGALLGVIGISAWAVSLRRASLNKNKRKKLDWAIKEAGKLEQIHQTNRSYLDEHDEVMKKMNARVREAKREAAKVVAEEVQDLSDDEIEAKLKKYGYL